MWKEDAVSTLLVIEDDPAIRSVLISLFQEEGHIVIAAGTGKRALDLLTKILPTVITVDYNLPDMNGFQLVQAIRAISGLQGIPIVLVTAASVPLEVQKQVHTVVRKPFEISDLLDIVNPLL